MQKLRPLVFPVIHVQNAQCTMENADIAFDAGCDGVFLISMDGHDEVLEPQARAVKARHPNKQVGINFLSRAPHDAIRACAEAGLDMTWIDNAQVRTGLSLDAAHRLACELSRHSGHKVFGGVAFKYQRPEPNPGLAAVRAKGLGMIPTTTGIGTGRAADLAKIEAMYQAVAGSPLAIASGITPDNVLQYAPYLSHILVATGVSKDEYNFDFELLCQMMGKLTTGFALGNLPPIGNNSKCAGTSNPQTSFNSTN